MPCSRHAGVVEAHPEGKKEIGYLDSFIHPGLAVHAHHAQAERMTLGNGADAQLGHQRWRVGKLGNSRNSSMAPLRKTPRPARITGFLAERINSMA